MPCSTPGRTYAFNSLFLDPYLWKLHLGGQRLVQRARAAGSAVDSVVVTAGIPELDDAVALVDELREIGIEHVVFKPGTVKQIRQVIAIADAVAPLPLIMQIEGGKAGGHHSWEDLDELLLTTYADLRAHDNIVVVRRRRRRNAGGGLRLHRRHLGAPSRIPGDAHRRRPRRHRGDGDPRGDHRPRGEAAARRHPGHAGLDRRRHCRRRHGVQPQPARRGHPRDRQHRVPDRPPARRGRRRRRGHRGPPRRDHRGAEPHVQAVLRRRRRP